MARVVAQIDHRVADFERGEHPAQRRVFEGGEGTRRLETDDFVDEVRKAPFELAALDTTIQHVGSERSKIGESICSARRSARLERCGTISALIALEHAIPTATSAARVSAARNRSCGAVTFGMRFQYRPPC